MQKLKDLSQQIEDVDSQISTLKALKVQLDEEFKNKNSIYQMLGKFYRDTTQEYVAYVKSIEPTQSKLNTYNVELIKVHKGNLSVETRIMQSEIYLRYRESFAGYNSFEEISKEEFIELYNQDLNKYNSQEFNNL